MSCNHSSVGHVYSFAFLSTILDAYLRPGVQIAKHALGKYIIAFACLLHIGWGVLLLVNPSAGNATPLSIIFALLGNDRWLVITVLFFVAFLAAGFLDLRLRKLLNITVLSMLLIPQQILLWCSAGAGIYATLIQQYADGVHRSWAHILADQTPVILMAFLYTIALLETRHVPVIQIGNSVLLPPGQTLKIIGEPGK